MKLELLMNLPFHVSFLFVMLCGGALVGFLMTITNDEEEPEYPMWINIYYSCILSFLMFLFGEFICWGVALINYLL
jgi:hypothetical protein